MTEAEAITALETKVAKLEADRVQLWKAFEELKDRVRATTTKLRNGVHR